MINILITGSNGQLGSTMKDISKDYSYKFFFTNKDQLDISNFEDVNSYVVNNDINVIINCSAYTAVDDAEDNKELVSKINSEAVKNIALISKELKIKLIHISTDYVFDGNSYKPYLESDDVNPCSVYGKTKLDGENAILKYNLTNSIIIRTSWVYSLKGKNFLKTMLELGSKKDNLNVVFDQVGTPTYAKDLAKTILEILPKIENDNTQIYHYSNEGVLSWYDFAQEIMNNANLKCEINPIESSQYPTKAKRPYYSVLNKSKIKKDFDIIIPYWKDSLMKCLKEWKK